MHFGHLDCHQSQPGRFVSVSTENYEVLFDDGFVKIQKARRMVKVKDGKQLGQSPLFDPVKGTKQERRDKKRKLNVAQLFGKQPRSKQLKPDQRSVKCSG